METRKVPAILTLLGCSVAVICTYVNGYTLLETAKVLLVVLIIFLILGIVIKIIIDKNIPPVDENDEQVDDEGAVIEKTSEEDFDEDGTVISGGNDEGRDEAGN